MPFDSRKQAQSDTQERLRCLDTGDAQLRDAAADRDTFEKLDRVIAQGGTSELQRELRTRMGQAGEVVEQGVRDRSEALDAEHAQSGELAAELQREAQADGENADRVAEHRADLSSEAASRELEALEEGLRAEAEVLVEHENELQERLGESFAEAQRLLGQLRRT